MNDQDNELYERLVTVLDAYGADAARWPAAERQQLLRFVGGNAAARRRLREAEALDRLLAKAGDEGSGGAASLDRLAADILAGFTAGTAARHDRVDGVVVPFPAGRADPRRGRAPVAPPVSVWRRRGLMAAALAACFACGIYLGDLAGADFTLDATDSVAGVATEGDQVADLGTFFDDDDLTGDLL